MIEEISELSKKAIIVRLSISSWPGRITDKIATEELLEMKAAKKGAGTFSKILINKKHFKNIRTALASMNEHHNVNTMPWDNNGGRLLPVSKYDQYVMRFKEIHEAFTNAVEVFIYNYNNYIIEADEFLGDLFTTDEYPSKNEMQEKFCMEIEFSKVSEANDFRVDIPEEERLKIQKQIEDRVNAKYTDSMNKLWNRIHSTIKHVVERLKDENSIFRNTLIENIDNLSAVLPQLNVLDDEDINTIAIAIKENLCSLTPDSLRTDLDLRKEVWEKAVAILTQIDELKPEIDELKPEIED